MEERIDSLLQYGLHLGTWAVFAGQRRALGARISSLLIQLQLKIQHRRIDAPELLDPIGVQRAILNGEPTSTEELQACENDCRAAWSKWKQRVKEPPIVGAEMKGLLEVAKSVSAALQETCDKRVADLEEAAAALRQRAEEVWWAGGTVDRRVLPANLMVFLSYAHEDKSIAKAIHQRLRAAGIRTWMDEHSMAGRGTLPVGIADGISEASHFCVLLSPASVASDWVQYETSIAMAQELSRRRPKVIPMRVRGPTIPNHLVDRPGPAFDDFERGMANLWRYLGLPEHARWSLSEFPRLLRYVGRLLETVRWCRQADSFLPIDDEPFANLADAESYFHALGLAPRDDEFPRFVCTRLETTHTSEGRQDARITFDDFFFRYDRCYLGGTALIAEVVELIRALAQREAAEGGDADSAAHLEEALGRGG